MDRKISHFDIIENWINQAFSSGLKIHLKYFWTIRDIFENKIIIDENRKKEAIEFLKNNCKESNDKNILLDILV